MEGRGGVLQEIQGATLLRPTLHLLTRYGHDDGAAVFNLHGVGPCARHLTWICGWGVRVLVRVGRHVRWH